VPGSKLSPGGASGSKDEENMTEHVVTRFYRPPELMLSPNSRYSYSVDMWSVGCILAELLGRQPLFPGTNFVHQLTLIFDTVGSPEPHQVRLHAAYEAACVLNRPYSCRKQ
jgi:serine/threonine protein kinase